MCFTIVILLRMEGKASLSTPSGGPWWSCAELKSEDRSIDQRQKYTGPEGDKLRLEKVFAEGGCGV